MPTQETAVVWDPRFLAYDFGASHPFSERPRGLAVELLRNFAPSDSIHWMERVEPLPRGELETFHTPEYIATVEQLGRRGRGEPLDAGDTPSFAGCHEAAARLGAGTVAATRWALERPGRRAFQPGGGLHHAHSDRASGFCIYNDVALAIRYALDGPPHLHRVAYLDIDAHHGDGVMYGHYEDGRLLDIDVHQDGRTIFPGTGAVVETGRADGEGLKVNVPLPPGSGDEAFLPLVRSIVPPMLQAFRPELIIVQHGVDGHAADGLAQLQYTQRSYRQFIALVLEQARELGDRPVVVTGGGGYTPENVTRTLARTGVQLTGGPVPSMTDALPAEWCASFREQLDREPPTQFSDLPPEYRSPWSDDRTENLLTELGTSLGRTFSREDFRSDDA